MSTDKPSQKVKQVVRSLPVKLTDLELVEAGHNLATVVQDISTEESRQADIKASMKARLAELEGRRTQLAIIVARREEYREVTVEITHDYQRGVIQDIRTDTGEVVSTRTMSESERQQQLAL